MIVFDLNCCNGHTFEVWFRSSADYDEQRTHGEVECPVCGDRDVSKAVMAPNIGAKSNQTSSNHVSSSHESSIQASECATNAHDTHDADGSMPIEFVDQLSVGLSTLPNELQQEVEKVLAKDKNDDEGKWEYVDEDFAEEARKIHYGESDARGIDGEASEEEAADLLEEGVDILPLPLLRKPGPTDA